MATVDAIKKLHTSTIDTRRAYEKAHEETDELQLKMRCLFAVAHDLTGNLQPMPGVLALVISGPSSDYHIIGN